MKQILIPACTILLTFTGCQDNRDNNNHELADDKNDQNFRRTDINKDVDFAVGAASGGMTEVEMGKLTVSNAKSVAVKQFGQEMINDHSKSNEVAATGLSKKHSIAYYSRQ